jgi:hypothetical protein
MYHPIDESCGAPALTEEDEVSGFSEAPSLTAASDDSTVSSELAEPANPSPRGEKGRCQDDVDPAVDTPAEQQLCEFLRKEGEKAYALYARNGDTSGLLAVMATARKECIEGRSGMPKF